MTRRRVPLYAMAVVVVALLAIVGAILAKGGSTARGAAPNPDTYTPPPPNGWGTGSSTTRTSTAPPVTGVATPTTAAQLTLVDKPVSAAGSVLAPPPAAAVRQEDAPNDCRSLVDQGWQALDCQTATTPGGSLTYLIEVNPEPAYVATRAFVFRRAGNGGEQVVLQAIDDSGTRYDTSEVEAAVAPIGAGGAPEIVMGFPQVGGSLTSVEVVQWPGVVAFHEALNGGVVQSSPGRLDTWAQTATGGFVHDRIVQGALGWHIVGEEEVLGDDVPTVSILA